MPKGMGYGTGGKVPGKSSSRLPGEGASGVDVGLHGAGMGNSYDSPNATKHATPEPGGYGSKGGPSSSKASK